MQTITNRFQKFISADWGFVGVIVFFILHGYVQFVQEVAFTSLLLLFLKLLVEAVLLFFISRWLLGTTRKANLFTALVFILTLYFGVIQDYLVQFSFISFITRFRYFIPFILLLIVVLFIWMKRTKRPLYKTVLFLNTLLLIYIFIDAGRLIVLGVARPKTGHEQLAKLNLTPCDTCHKPPVYLILLDTYWGSAALKEYYHYDNTRFEHFLSDQGFHVVTASHSNYLFTMYSMASLLNMQYLGNIGEPVTSNHYGFVTAARAIKFNPVRTYFNSLGYEFNNFSIFDMEGVPAGFSSGILPAKVQLVTSQTMYYRVKQFLPIFFVQNKWRRPQGAAYEKSVVAGQEKLMEVTLAESRKPRKKPAFTYAHFFMPHGPFVLDSNGHSTRITERILTLPKDSLENMFLQYEVYTNRRMTSFISDLKKNTGGQAVIIVMSDHGYQEARTKNPKLRFYNLNAVYLPGQNYAAWYNNMSNVNQFRALFNTLYHQQLPMLPDSIVTK